MTQKGKKKDFVEVCSCRNTSVAGGWFRVAVLQLEIMWKYSACLFGCNAHFLPPLSRLFFSFSHLPNPLFIFLSKLLLCLSTLPPKFAFSLPVLSFSVLFLLLVSPAPIFSSPHLLTPLPCSIHCVWESNDCVLACRDCSYI